MSTLIVSEFVSLNGVVEAPGGEPTHPHSGWTIEFTGDEQIRYKLAETEEAGCLLLGRVTYEGFAEAWPGRSGPFADKYNSMPKHVVSTTLTEPLEWSNSTLVTGDVVREIEKLKERDGEPILVVGSATLVHTLLENDLVDEVRLMVFPVLIADGKRMFPSVTERKRLRLVDTTTFASGVVVHTYVPAPR